MGKKAKGKKNVKGEKFRVRFEHGQHTNQTQQQQLTNYSKLFLCFVSAVNIINHFPDYGAGHGPGRPAPRSAPVSMSEIWPKYYISPAELVILEVSASFQTLFI